MSILTQYQGEMSTSERKCWQNEYFTVCIISLNARIYSVTFQFMIFFTLLFIQSLDSRFSAYRFISLNLFISSSRRKNGKINKKNRHNKHFTRIIGSSTVKSFSTKRSAKKNKRSSLVII